MAPSRVLTTWGKSRPTFAIKGGVVEGRVVSPEEIKALATLPPREVLLAQVAGAFNAPIQALVNVLAGPIRALASVLDQIHQHQEKTI
jgi:large subunit ribosomal protein L10